jgi:hypothetical protein
MIGWFIMKHNDGELGILDLNIISTQNNTGYIPKGIYQNLFGGSPK